MPNWVSSSSQRALALLAGHLEGLEDGQEVLLDGQLSENGFLLGKVAHAHPRAAVHRVIGNVVALEDDPAAIRAHEADDHVEAGGLAGAIGAEKPDDLAPLEPDIDAVDHGAAAVNLDQFLRLENAPGGVSRGRFGRFQGLCHWGDGAGDWAGERAGEAEFVPVVFGWSSCWMVTRLGPMVLIFLLSRYMIM